MGVLFWLLGYISGFLTLVLLALSISSGLYLLAELAEEFPTLSGKITKYLLVVILSLHVLLFIVGLPFFQTFMGMLAHLIYASMLANFPFVDLISVSSIGSAIAFIASNLMWLLYFTKAISDPLQVIGFFVLCVWCIPCALFVSLTLNENTLPVTANGATIPELDGLSSPGKKKTMFKIISDMFMNLFENSGIFRAMKVLNDKRK